MIAHLIRNKNGQALVMAADSRERRIVPSRYLEPLNGQTVTIPDDQWARGIEQTFEFKDVVIDVETVTKYFHSAGLYSSADIRASRAVARAALWEAAGEVLTRLLDQEEVIIQ
jgi:hypothetical protein